MPDWDGWWCKALGILRLQSVSYPRFKRKYSTNSFDLTDTLFSSHAKNVKVCDYYNIDSLLFNTDSNSLIIIHVNVRSLNKNFDLFFEFLESFPSSPDIIYLSMTRIWRNPLVNVDIPGYNSIFKNSLTNAGSVPVYISTDYQYHTAEDKQ